MTTYRKYNPEKDALNVEGVINGAFPDDLRLRCMRCIDCEKELIEIDD